MVSPLAQHYRLSMPLSTHWAEIDCRTEGCSHWQLGWVTTVDIGTVLGKEQAGFIRHKSGRSFREERVGDTLVKFIFSAGQKCFRTHRRQKHHASYLKSSALNSHLNGGLIPVEREQWIDDFNETSYRTNRVRKGV